MLVYYSNRLSPAGTSASLDLVYRFVLMMRARGGVVPLDAVEERT
jgi:hypothetical protein